MSTVTGQYDVNATRYRLTKITLITAGKPSPELMNYEQSFTLALPLGVSPPQGHTHSAHMLTQCSCFLSLAHGLCAHVPSPPSPLCPWEPASGLEKQMFSSPAVVHAVSPLLPRTYSSTALGCVQCQGANDGVTLIQVLEVGSPGTIEPGAVFLQLTFSSPDLLCEALVEGIQEKEKTQYQPGWEYTSSQTRNKGKGKVGQNQILDCVKLQ